MQVPEVLDLEVDQREHERK